MTRKLWAHERVTRKNRLLRIAGAVARLEGRLLQIESWQERQDCFTDLYYLKNLARKAE